VLWSPSAALAAAAVLDPVPPNEMPIGLDAHWPVVIVPTVFMSVPTRFGAVIPPASMAFVTTPLFMTVTKLLPAVPTAPVSVGNWAACRIPERLVVGNRAYGQNAASQ